ncbi:hypothetical protein U1701_06560 [Sphingomonas sp. PB2P19]|uniref:hypothetical protein n=1 Tax=Sphingomonas rhamnosi TaxID=3096156 RepID=UPI002FCAA5EA
MQRQPVRPFRSRDWFADPARSDMTALYRAGRCDAPVDDAEIARRRDAPPPPLTPPSNTPGEELYREKTAQFADGEVLDFAVKYRGIAAKTPRHNH